MNIWLTHDPRTARISIRATEPSDSSFPPGPRGRGWKVRQATIDPDIYAQILSGYMDDDELDRIHRELWTENGDTAWPSQ